MDFMRLDISSVQIQKDLQRSSTATLIQLRVLELRQTDSFHYALQSSLKIATESFQQTDLADFVKLLGNEP